MLKYKIQVMWEGKIRVEEVEGERCQSPAGFEDVEFFYHHPGIADKIYARELWRISEVVTGKSLTEYYITKAEARKELTDKLLYKSPGMLKVILEANRLPVEVG